MIAMLIIVMYITYTVYLIHTIATNSVRVMANCPSPLYAGGMSATLNYCRYCPTAKKENKRRGRKEIRIYHKLLRRISVRVVRQEAAL